MRGARPLALPTRKERQVTSARLEVRVQPRARRNDVAVLADGRLKVWVTAAPEGGKANDSVIALLAKQLGVPKRRARIATGHTARDKVLEIEELGRDEVLMRLEAKGTTSKEAE